MSLWSRLGAAWRGLRGAKMSSLDLWREITGGRMSKSGQQVTVATAFQVPAVYACSRKIGNGIAQVPFKLMKADGANRRAAVDHYLYEMLYRKPNGFQTAFQFFMQLSLHRVLCGNAFVWKIYVGPSSDRRIKELLPLTPGIVTVEQLPDFSLRYKVRMPDGREVEIPASDIWHLRGPSWSGWFGLDAVKLAREAIGLAMATESSQAEMHKDGVRPSGLYSIDGVLTKEQYPELRRHIMSQATEEGKGLMLLDRKATFTPTTMTGVDAQHLETRRFQVEEICRTCDVMPIMIGQSDKAATYASAEQMFLAHVVHTLGPHYRDIEQSADVNLLTEKERAEGYYTKFNANALMRGDSKSQAEYFSKALGSGGSPPWMTQDEVRELCELNPKGGKADELAQATNPGQAPPSAPEETPPKDDSNA